MGDCLFCGIVAGTIPSNIVFSNDDVVAFVDINPQAPVHLLVIPRDHAVDLVELGRDPAMAGAYVAGIAAVAKDQHLEQFRTVINTGAGVGQSVFHLHAHLLAGRAMGWPPG